MTDRDVADKQDSSAPKGVAGTVAAMVAMLLGGGVLLDIDRINSVRDTLDKIAHVAAFEAAASTRPSERKHICQKRFNKTVWTDSEVTVDDIEVSVTENARGREATVSYDATVQLVVGRFFGFSEVVISGEADAVAPSKQTVAATP